jgi:hypothetical protein
MPVELTARAVGISGRRFLAIRGGAVRPRTARRIALAWEAIMFAQERLRSDAIPSALISTEVRDVSQLRGRVIPEGLGILKRYVEERPSMRGREAQCVVCGDPLNAGGRARYCSARCRKRAQRKTSRAGAHPGPRH